MSHIQTISVHELASRQSQGDIDLIDVRTPAEFQSVHAANARNVPLDKLDPKTLLQQRRDSEGESLYVICKSGVRGSKACQKLLDSGLDQVFNVDGGTDAWVEAGLPVVRGKKMMSLERQVRIAAGFIVLSGAVAAMVTKNIYVVGIPAFVGAGLMFAGITDTCAMGMLIAKMPWNQTDNRSSNRAAV